MLYADRFAGHLDMDDPRNALTAAGGCPWPTIPPYRVQLSSTNASGQFAFLRTLPIILELIASPVQHGLATWETIEAPGVVYNATVYKVYTPSAFPLYSWQLVLLLAGWPAEVPFAQDASGPCNVDVTWGDLSIPYGAGSPGSEFKQFQVEFDQLRSPGWSGP